jgi:hypothetical protein
MVSTALMAPVDNFFAPENTLIAGVLKIIIYFFAILAGLARSLHINKV